MKHNLKRDQKVIESVILWVYTVYTIALIAGSISMNWPDWVAPVAGIFLFMFWFFYIRREFTDHTRAIVFVVMVIMNLSIYGYFSDFMLGVIATDTALLALLSLYLYQEVILISSIAYAGIILTHIFITHKMTFDTRENIITNAMGISAFVTVEIASYWQIKIQKRYMQELDITIDELEKAEKVKDDFMANVSHEIRTPINTIYGFSEMILQEEISDEARNLTKEIQTAGLGLLNIVADILDFSELSSDNIEVLEEPYSISSMINDVINMTSARNRGKGLEIIVNCDPLIPCSLLGDEEKLRRVIMNIINNAIAYTEEGCVVISVGARRESYGVNLFVKVKDTGIGISEQNLEMIFDSFSQIDATRTRKNAGLGLGLPISKAIIDKMGGYLNIKSKEGEGTEVYFVVPQKILDERPMVAVENPESMKIISYFNQTKFANPVIRDAYSTMINDMVRMISLNSRKCNNFSELKIRLAQGGYTHVFISNNEYQEEREFFDELAKNITVVMLADSDRDHPKNIITLKKPVYCLSLAAALNVSGDTNVSFRGVSDQEGRFIAPDVRILVVDDNIMNLKVVEGLLRPYRIQVFTATSGAQALKTIESMDYDFVLMDHMMPEMDGVECFRKIRQKPGAYFAHVPIIALTANAIAGSREQFIQEGFADFISKPIEISILERVLRKFIPAEKMVSGIDINQIEFGEEKAREAKKFLRTVNSAEKRMESKNIANTESNKESISIIFGLLEASGVDTTLGVKYSGEDEQFYIETLRKYILRNYEMIDILSGLFDEQNWKKYLVAIHESKSAAATVGITGLAKEAGDMENAGKSGDTEYIKNYHNVFVRHLGEITEAIGKVVN